MIVGAGPKKERGKPFSITEEMKEKIWWTHMRPLYYKGREVNWWEPKEKIY